MSQPSVVDPVPIPVSSAAIIAPYAAPRRPGSTRPSMYAMNTGHAVPYPAPKTAPDRIMLPRDGGSAASRRSPAPATPMLGRNTDLYPNRSASLAAKGRLTRIATATLVRYIALGEICSASAYIAEKLVTPPYPNEYMNTASDTTRTRHSSVNRCSPGSAG